MNPETPIHKDMTIEEIFSLHPSRSQRLAQIMGEFGLQCAGCSAATYETLEAGMFTHGKDEKELSELIEQLNQALQEKLDLTSISLTERAAEKFKTILKEENKEGYSLRFSEKAAGCNGFEYLLDFSEQPNEDDVTYNSRGIDIHIQKNSVPRLLGSVIDYTDGLQGAGFKITNPNVKSSCGCGSSHGY